jgi:hypothetical protein
MATKTKDARQVTFIITHDELTAVLASKAQELNMIDFEPDSIEIFQQGDEKWEISFLSHNEAIPE